MCAYGYLASVALGMALLQDGQTEEDGTVFRRINEALGGRYLLANPLLGRASYRIRRPAPCGAPP